MKWLYHYSLSSFGFRTKRAGCKRARSRNIYLFTTCSFQFANAGRTATLSQQEKKNSAGVQRGRLYLSRRCTFGEFESLAVASRRPRSRLRMLEP
jgi:hypothetical protein